MNFCLAWLQHWLHASLHAHLRVHLFRDEEEGRQHYLLCGCSRVFWPGNWRELTVTMPESIGNTPDEADTIV